MKRQSAKFRLDWTTVAVSMIEREELPVLVIARNGSVAAVNAATERLFGLARQQLVGRLASQLLGKLPVRGALDGRIHRVSCQTKLVDGRQLISTLELQPIGTGSMACLIALVSSSRTLPKADSAAVSSVRYAISTSPTEFGRLLMLSREGEERSGPELVGKLCHQVLHRRDKPCRGCPLLRTSEHGDGRVGVVIPAQPDGAVMVVTAQRTREDRFTLTAYRLGRSVLASLLRAQIESLADRAALSMRERQVLDLLLFGRSAREIGTVLGISAHTAKFHQAKILEKLGADSRLDVLRLLL